MGRKTAPFWKQICLPFESFSDFQAGLASKKVRLECYPPSAKQWVTGKGLAPIAKRMIALGYRLFYWAGLVTGILWLLLQKAPLEALLVCVGAIGSALLWLNLRATIRWGTWVGISIGFFGALLKGWWLVALPFGTSLYFGCLSAVFWFWSQRAYCMGMSKEERTFLDAYWNADIWFYLDGELWRRWDWLRVEPFLFGNYKLPIPTMTLNPESVRRFCAGLDRLCLRGLCDYEVTHKVTFNPANGAEECQSWYVQLERNGRAFTAEDTANSRAAEWKAVCGQWIHQQFTEAGVKEEATPGGGAGEIVIREITFFSLDERKMAYRQYHFWFGDLVKRIQAGGTMKARMTNSFGDQLENPEK